MSSRRTRPTGAALLCAIFLLAALPLKAQLPAFPGAQGMGRFATGGRGGTVYHVTTLADTGAGSFRNGATVANTTIVFDVGGVIRLNSLVDVAPGITIAGQTAPGEGITLYGHRLSYSGANNSITRFLRVRMGVNGDGNDAIGIADGHDMIFDHLSVSWGQDETFSASGNITNVTIQSSIISQGLQSHSAGGLIQANGGVSIVRCLYIDNDTRNPKVKFINEFVNNVIYNWDDFAYNMGGDSAGDSYVNAFNNYFINGPVGGAPAFSGGNLNFHIFATNNWQDANQDGQLNGAIIPLASYGPMDAQASPYPYPVALSNALPPLTAIKLAVSDVGASWKRDAVDERMMTELTSWGTLGSFINTEFEAPMSGPGIVRNGTPYPDTDQDGMPDFWESATGSNPAVADNNAAGPSGSGYTRLEDYLNWLAEPHGIALTNQTCDIELRQFTRGFTNTGPVFSVANATNGTVSLVSGGQRARFVPTPGHNGRASFTFTVTDADGSTFTRPMNLFFTPAAQSFTSVWRGDDLANNWNTAGDPNWFNGQSLLFPFLNGQSVLFDHSGSTNPFINLTGSLQPALVTFDTAKNYSFSGIGSLDGAMTLNKTGTGSLALFTTNNFAGPTTVSNGTLLIHGSLPQSTVTVRSGGTLGGNGRIGQPPALQSGARLAPGNGIGGPGTLTISNSLALPHNITHRFDLSDDPAGSSKTNDQIVVLGTLSVTGTNFIRVNLLDGPLLNGTYPLFKYNSFIGGLSNFVLINANGTLTNPPGEIAIHVANVRTPGNLKWVGNGVNNNWDNGATTNWLNGATLDAFYFFDSVRFDNSGSTNPAVNLIGSLTPQSTTFEATKNYTVSGSGAISGYGTFLKTNSGTLTMTAINDYAGPTIFGGGVFSVAQIGNAGIASPLGGAEADAENLLFTGGTLRYTGSSAGTDRAMTLGPGGGTLDITPASTTLTLNNSITGGNPLTKTGAGRVDFAVASDYSGGTVVRGGTVRLVSDAGLGSGPVVLDGSTNSTTFLFGSNDQALNNALHVTGTNNFSRNAGNNSITTLTGNGTLYVVTNSGTTFTIAGSMSGFSGTLVARAIPNLRFNPSSGSADATFDLGNTNTLLNNRNGGLTIQLGALIGGPNTILQGASSANSLTTYVIGGKNLDTTFAGRITEVIPARTAAITKTGTGTLTLSGNNTYTGPTVVNGGALLVNNTSGHGTGSNTVTIASGATLSGTGYIRGPVVVNNGGNLAPGATLDAVGTLTIRSNLTLNVGANLSFQLGPVAASDRLVVSNALALNGTLHITNVAGFVSGTYTLINYGSTLSGSLTIGSKPAGYSCAVNLATPGQVRLVVAVQTPPYISSVQKLGSNLVLSGTGPTNETYYVLTSTNVALPLFNWVRLATNQFNGAGQFTFSDAISADPLSYYRLQLP